MDTDNQGNALVNNSKAVLYDCDNCLVRLPDGHVAVLQGLSDYVVAEEGNVILVCKRDDQNIIRSFVNTAQLDLGTEYV
jgi:mannose-1-phosphate guanylyltransferase